MIPTRINLFDLSRATEQTAVIAAAILGRVNENDTQDTAVRDASIRSMYGYFTQFAGKRMLCLYPDDRDRKRLGFGKVLKSMQDEIAGKDWSGCSWLRQPKLDSVSTACYGGVKVTSSLDECRGFPPIVVCASPIDGKAAVSKGQEGGSISVLCGGPPGSIDNPRLFQGRAAGSRDYKGIVKDLEREEEVQYFVVSLSPGIASRLSGGGGHENRGSGQTRRPTLEPEQIVDRLLRTGTCSAIDGKLFVGDKPTGDLLPFDAFEIARSPSATSFEKDERPAGFHRLQDWIERSIDFEALYEAVWATRARPTVAILPGRAGKWTDAIDRRFRRRSLHGSSVAAALTALLHEAATHASFTVARRCHVINAAVAARSLGGEMLAVPVRVVRQKESADREGPMLKKSKKTDVLGYDVPDGARLLTGRDFAPGPAAFFIATGISDHSVLRGVRFRTQHEVSVHSLLLSMETGSRREVRRRVDIREHPYFGIDSSHTPMEKVLKQFERDLGLKISEEPGDSDFG